MSWPNIRVGTAPMNTAAPQIATRQAGKTYQLQKNPPEALEPGFVRRWDKGPDTS